MRCVAALLACLLAMSTACGDDEPELIVSAASSLKRAFTAYGEGYDGAETRSSFAGSDELAAQIRRGARPDVFAAANTRLPGELFREGRVERPVVFAANRLVVAVPARSRIDSVDDLERPGLDLAVGAASVPVGQYTREVLSRLGGKRAEAILANVRSNEPDVAGVVAKMSIFS